MQIDNKEEESEDVLASNGVGLLFSYYLFGAPSFHVQCLLHTLIIIHS